jgi:hypothetical protein
MKHLFPAMLLMATVLLFSCNTEDNVKPLSTTTDQADLRTPAVHCQSDLLTGIPDNITVVGTTTLTRNKNGLNMTLHADDLVPGHTYTVWWVIWNYPENCDGACDDPDIFDPDVEPELLFATGNVAGNSGKGIFGAGLSEDDATGSINTEFFGLPSYGGLHDALHAEVHIVLRDHGPAIPGQVDEQISTYAGGCDPNNPDYNDGHGFIPFFTTTPDEVGECSSLFVSVFPGDCGD